MSADYGEFDGVRKARSGNTPLSNRPGRKQLVFENLAEAEQEATDCQDAVIVEVLIVSPSWDIGDCFGAAKCLFYVF